MCLSVLEKFAEYKSYNIHSLAKTDEELNNFYKTKFMDYQDPITSIHVNVEGNITYNALLFIPKKPFYDFYSDRDEKGLQLYTKGVFILDKCKDLMTDFELLLVFFILFKTFLW